MRPFIILVLVLLLIALLPTWSYMEAASTSLGYWPSIVLGLLVALVVAAMFVRPGPQD